MGKINKLKFHGALSNPISFAIRIFAFVLFAQLEGPPQNFGELVPKPPFGQISPPGSLQLPWQTLPSDQGLQDEQVHGRQWLHQHQSQKAFLSNINGCMEHIKVLQEVIQDAKANKKTVHISRFDLTDAFGSVSHGLVWFPNLLAAGSFSSQMGTPSSHDLIQICFYFRVCFAGCFEVFKRNYCGVLVHCFA